MFEFRCGIWKYDLHLLILENYNSKPIKSMLCIRMGVLKYKVLTFQYELCPIEKFEISNKMDYNHLWCMFLADSMKGSTR